MNRSLITFSILVNDAPESGDEFREAVDQFSEGFHVERELSKKILRCAPVLLLNDLSKNDVSDVKSILTGITENVPVSFRVTSAELPPLPEVTWTERPNFDDRAPEDPFLDAELRLNGNALSCPNCDEMIILNRSSRDLPVADSSDHARLQAASEDPTAPTEPGTEEEPEQPTERSEPDRDPEPAEPVPDDSSPKPGEPVPDPSGEPADHEAAPVEQDAETDEYKDEEEALSDEPIRASGDTGTDEQSEDVEMEEVPDLETEDDEMDALFDDLEEEDDEDEHADFLAELDEELNELEEMEFEGTDDAGGDEETTPDPDRPSSAPAGTDDPSASQPADPDEASYNVFISGAGSADAQQTISLLTDIRGCTSSEAQDLVERPITPVESGISKERAHEIERRFNKIDVNVNITQE